MGALDYILNVRVTRSSSNVLLDQSVYRKS